jgi:hypothetical protein
MEGRCHGLIRDSPPPPNGVQPLVGQSLLIIEASLSHSDIPHSVLLLWTSDQSDAETSTLKHTTRTRNIHVLGGIRTDASDRPQIDALEHAATGI